MAFYFGSFIGGLGSGLESGVKTGATIGNAVNDAQTASALKSAQDQSKASAAALGAGAPGAGGTAGSGGGVASDASHASTYNDTPIPDVSKQPSPYQTQAALSVADKLMQGRSTGSAQSSQFPAQSQTPAPAPTPAAPGAVDTSQYTPAPVPAQYNRNGPSTPMVPSGPTQTMTPQQRANYNSLRPTGGGPPQYLPTQAVQTGPAPSGPAVGNPAPVRTSANGLGGGSPLAANLAGPPTGAGQNILNSMTGGNTVAPGS